MFKKKPGICQAWPDHPLITFPDRGRIGAFNVGNGDELITDPFRMVAVFDREKLLMVLHACNQCSVRYVEKLLFERTGNGYRPFDQVIDFVQEATVDVN